MIHARWDVAIETVGLAKAFDQTTAVASLDLTVPSGQMFGLVVPMALEKAQPSACSAES